MVCDLNYTVDIREQGFINGDFIIQGTAISSVITSNNHKFLSEELSKSASSLKGVPLLVDHVNEVSAIKGRVLSGIFNETEDKVDFRAKVIDEDVKELIKDGRLNTVSVGAVVEDIEEEDGLFIPRGIKFKELSLVAVPADDNATFQIALKEAYNANKDDIQINTMEVKMSEENAKVETETEEVKEESKEEAKPEETKEPEAEPEKEAEEESEVTEEKVKLWVTQALKAFKESDEDEKPVEPEPKEEPKAEPEEEEEAEEVEEENVEVEESFGSIRGGAFTYVR